jgi:protein-L-isoaspartate(D-aspartate) O-methyltransferase
MNKLSLLEKLRQSNVPDSIISAFGRVNREEFIPEEFLNNAYDDVPIPLAEPESSISQPSTIALMLQLLEISPTNKILEIGSGSGYVLSILSELSFFGKIYGLEINPNLAISSIKKLSNKKNIIILNRDGYQGLPSQAPFDKILISASAQDMSVIYNLLDQLKDPGILVAPIKDSLWQIIKKDKKIEKHEFPGFRFVKLVKTNS